MTGGTRGAAGEEGAPRHGEEAEREAAHLRGGEGRAAAEREQVRAGNPAFAALADNVRDYGIFLMDEGGVIRYWGEGARLIKWWTSEEAEGAHLRLLYPQGGSEDGTAEAHLRDAAERGEYVGEGQRVRRDGSTFWAHVSLTALRDPAGGLMGFVKVARDMTARRGAESVMASAMAAQSTRETALGMAREADAARQRAEEVAEFEREHARGTREYLTHELAAERAAREERGG